VGLAVVLADRHIFAWHETLFGQPETNLVVLRAGIGIVEEPAATGATLDATTGLVFSRTVPHHAAPVRHIAEAGGVDMPISRQRQEETIAVVPVPFGMARFARQFELDAVELCFGHW
jgi:hypothetical protein